MMIGTSQFPGRFYVVVVLFPACERSGSKAIRMIVSQEFPFPIDA